MGLECGNEAAIKASIVAHNKSPVHLDLCWSVLYDVEAKHKIDRLQVMMVLQSLATKLLTSLATKLTLSLLGGWGRITGVGGG